MEFENSEERWIGYSDLNMNKYTSLLTVFGCFSTLFTHPLNVLVIRQQVGMGISANHGVLRSLKEMKTSFGWRSLFRGWTPVALMGMPSQVLYFNIIEATREDLQSYLLEKVPSCSKNTIDGLQSTFSSIIANSLALLVYTPADIISNRMIIQNQKQVSILSLSRQIYQESKVRGFYQGYTSSLIVGSLFSAQWWWTYSVFRRHLRGFQVLDESPLLLDASTGFIAGIVATVVAHPADTIKTRIMTGFSNSTSFPKTLFDIVSKEGVRCLYRGLLPSVYISCLSSTGFAVSYEILKKIAMD